MYEYLDQEGLDLYDSLLKTDLSDLKSQITFLNKKTITLSYVMGYIPLNVAIGNVVNINNVTASSNYAYICVPCLKDDSFVVTATCGSNAPRSWAFLDVNKKLLSVAAAYASPTALTVTASQDGYFISDTAIASTHTCVGTFTVSPPSSWEYDIIANKVSIDIPAVGDMLSSGFNINTISNSQLNILNYTVGSTSIPANLPITVWDSETVAFLYTHRRTNGSQTAGDTQIFESSNAIWIRTHNGSSWGSWYKLYETNKEFVVDVSGDGDYTSFCEGVTAALQHNNSVVYVRPGTYDIISEMIALKGADYFTNFTAATEQLELSNNIRIVADPGAVLTCNYTGNNAYVKSYFAPINLKQFNNTIENLTIEASNVRYCIHDDQWNFTEHYKHIVNGCRLIIDNSNNADWNRRLAFGGGLGVNGYIEFNNCYFKSVGLDGTAYSKYGSMGYHNSPDANAQSLIFVNNCYFADNSTFRLTYYGTSTKISRALVSGCSLGRAMEIEYESSTSTPQNCEIIDCNNVIRT